MLPPLIIPYRANNRINNTASILPTDTEPIITPDRDNSRIQPVIDRQLSSCCEKPDSARRDSNNKAVRLMK